MLEQLRTQVAEATIAMWKLGLTEGSEGNVSTRDSESGCVAITGSHVPYSELTPDDIVIVTFDGAKLWGSRNPSQETPMHTYLYRNRPEVMAIMHTHSEYAVAASIARRSIPPITFGLALNIGSEVVALDWVEPGTEDMGVRAHRAMLARNARAALFANHGAVVLATTLKGALDAARALEEGARMYALALAFGEPIAIPADRVKFLFRLWQEHQLGIT